MRNFLLASLLLIGMSATASEETVQFFTEITASVCNDVSGNCSVFYNGNRPIEVKLSSSPSTPGRIYGQTTMTGNVHDVGWNIDLDMRYWIDKRKNKSGESYYDISVSHLFKNSQGEEDGFPMGSVQVYKMSDMNEIIFHGQPRFVQVGGKTVHIEPVVVLSKQQNLIRYDQLNKQ